MRPDPEFSYPLCARASALVGKSFLRLPGAFSKSVADYRCARISFQKPSFSRENFSPVFRPDIPAFVKGFRRGALNFHSRGKISKIRWDLDAQKSFFETSLTNKILLRCASRCTFIAKSKSIVRVEKIRRKIFTLIEMFFVCTRSPNKNTSLCRHVAAKNFQNARDMKNFICKLPM